MHLKENLVNIMNQENESDTVVEDKKDVSQPFFKLKPTLSNLEKQKRSNFIKENIKLTAIKGDVTENNIKDFVFISYKSGDWEEIYKKYIAPLHIKYGLNIYCDAAFDDGNENWTVQMEKHITSKKCKAILCFLSEGYLGSYATLLEVMANRYNEIFAQDNSYKPIIPIILDDNKLWEEKLRTNKDLVGIENSGPEYSMFKKLLKNFLIVLDHQNNTIDSLTKEFMKKNIKEMIADTNINSYLSKSNTYSFIIKTLELTNATDYIFYDEYEPKLFFDNLVDKIKSSVEVNSDKIFSGENIPDFSVTTFTQKNKKNDFNFITDKNDYNIFILDYYTNNDENVVIPHFDDNNSRFLNQIGEGAFERKLVKKVTFEVIEEEGSGSVSMCIIDVIKEDAFNSCSYLEEIIFPNSLKYIGDTAFENCISLDNIVFPKNLKEIGEGVFTGCTNLTNIELSFEIKSIPKLTFKDCISLDDVYIPSSVNEIGENAFEGCISLKKIYIHQCVTSISKSAFIGCTNLQEVEGINSNIFTKENLQEIFGDTLWYKDNYSK